jgi:hypothetical protein
MNGGSFNYAYSRVVQFAEDLEYKLDIAGTARNPRFPEDKEPEWEPDVNDSLR